MLDAGDFEDYLELRDPKVKAAIAASKADVDAGRLRPAEKLRGELQGMLDNAKVQSSHCSARRGRMQFIRRFAERYWSFLVALFVPFLVAHSNRIAEEPSYYREPARVFWIVCIIYATVTVLCLGLLVHSWLIQRRCARNGFRLVFWTHLLLLPWLSTIVLALGKIMRSTRDLPKARGPFELIFFTVAEVRDYLKVLFLVNILMAVLWAIVAALKNKSSRPVSGPA